jgi:hypothetical protein
MAISLQWENEEKTIIHWTFDGPWTWADFETAQAEFHAMLRTVEHLVDVLADMRHAPALPRDTFANFKRMERKVVPNRDRVVLVTESMFIRGMARTFNQVFRNRPTQFLFADTIEGAHALLAQPRRSAVR